MILRRGNEPHHRVGDQPAHEVREGGRRWGDRGSASILTVAMITSVLCLASLLASLAVALGVKQRLASASDAAALAAADVAVGILPGVPCEQAARVAVANHVTLGSCEVDGLVVTVSSRASVLGLTAVERSTAGPPPPGEE